MVRLSAIERDLPMTTPPPKVEVALTPLTLMRPENVVDPLMVETVRTDEVAALSIWKACGLLFPPVCRTVEDP